MKDNKIVLIIASFLVGIIISSLAFQLNIFKTKDAITTETNSKVDVVKLEKDLKSVLPVDIKVKDGNKTVNLHSVKLTSQGRTEELFVDSKGEKVYAIAIDVKKLKEAKKEAEEAKKVKNKTDKPKVELFVMSYCPFGTQTEKGYLPAVQKLGDKIDAKVRFVNYVMHPSKGEGEENLLQYCIQKEMPKKFNSYLACFLEKGDSKGCLAKNGISKDALKNCLDETDKKYAVSANLKDKSKWLNGRFPKFNVQDDLNKKYGVQGSPTLVINGQKVETGRDANSIFKAICSAFKNPPKECKEELSTETPAPGFGYDNSGDNSSAGGCGA